VPINIVYYTIFFMATQPLKPNQQTLGQAIGKTASNVFNRTLGRLFGAGLNKGAEKGQFGGNPGTARWTTRSGSIDWRVKLTIPSDSALLQKIFFNRAGTGDTGTASRIMEPLAGTNGIVFPITPSVIVQHTATYSQLATTHANYPYYAYQNSEPANLTIVGEFPVQNQTDAAHWVATIHFLRSVTKMFFGGDDATRGNPPPILKLNGYGNHVFKNVPVIVTNFTCELRADVDYISTTQGSRQIQTGNNIYSFGGASATLPTTWAPSLSTITVQIQPVYSRDTVKNFSMQSFVNGDLFNYTGGKGGEGVGFI
jgi:hypothetical protein